MTAYAPACALPTKPPRSAVALVAIDIDGTLLRPDKRLAHRVTQAIHRARRRGVRVLLATARPPRSTRPVHHALQLDTPTVNYNGALVHDVLRGRFVQHRPLHPPLAGLVAALARRLFPRVRVDAEILDRWYTDAPPDEDQPVGIWGGTGASGIGGGTGVPPVRTGGTPVPPQDGSTRCSTPAITPRMWRPDVVCPVEAFTSSPTTKLMFSGVPAEVAQLHTAIRARFGGSVATVYGEPRLLQVVAAGVDKAAALAALAAAYGVPRERVMAIGDAGNDAGMLRWAGLGVALANATPAALAAADATVPANADDGVAVALERYVLQ